MQARSAETGSLNSNTSWATGDDGCGIGVGQDAGKVGQSLKLVARGHGLLRVNVN